MNTGKISGCAKGPTVHNGGGFLWFWLGNFEYSFEIQQGIGNSVNSWVYAIKRHIESQKYVDSDYYGRRFLIENIKEDGETRFEIVNGGNRFAFQMKSEFVPNFVSFLEMVVKSTSKNIGDFSMLLGFSIAMCMVSLSIGTLFWVTRNIWQ